jgi:hypothetical protein
MDEVALGVELILLDELCGAGISDSDESDEIGVPSSTVVATSSRVPVCSRCVSMSGI